MARGQGAAAAAQAPAMAWASPRFHGEGEGEGEAGSGDTGSGDTGSGDAGSGTAVGGGAAAGVRGVGGRRGATHVRFSPGEISHVRFSPAKAPAAADAVAAGAAEPEIAITKVRMLSRSDEHHQRKTFRQAKSSAIERLTQKTGGFRDRKTGAFGVPPSDTKEPERTDRILASPFAIRRRVAGDRWQSIEGFVRWQAPIIGSHVHARCMHTLRAHTLHTLHAGLHWRGRPDPQTSSGHVHMHPHAYMAAPILRPPLG